VGSIAQYLDPSLWSDRLHASVNGMEHATFWVGVLQILLIDFLLSGDNAVVIALACRGLPPRQRLWGIGIGVTLAVMLRIIFAAIATQLLQLPYLKLVSGLALFYIAGKLLVPEEQGGDQVKPAASLWGAIRIVVAADAIMSIDNILPVAAIARGNLALLLIGLAGTIPLIIIGATVMMALLDRFPILVWAGAALLGWIAGEIIATDPVVAGYLTAAFGETFLQEIAFAAAGAGGLVVIAVGGFSRRAR
jgi:YjbE family integral membrane protein